MGKIGTPSQRTSWKLQLGLTECCSSALMSSFALQSCGSDGQSCATVVPSVVLPLSPRHLLHLMSSMHQKTTIAHLLSMMTRTSTLLINHALNLCHQVVLTRAMF